VNSSASLKGLDRCYDDDPFHALEGRGFNAGASGLPLLEGVAGMAPLCIIHVD